MHIILCDWVKYVMCNLEIKKSNTVNIIHISETMPDSCSLGSHLVGNLQAFQHQSHNRYLLEDVKTFHDDGVVSIRRIHPVAYRVNEQRETRDSLDRQQQERTHRQTVASWVFLKTSQHVREISVVPAKFLIHSAFLVGA